MICRLGTVVWGLPLEAFVCDHSIGANIRLGSVASELSCCPFELRLAVLRGRCVVWQCSCVQSRLLDFVERVLLGYTD